mmetsp:Transcript_21411/g.35027  ORF Transcript_21411/g.35027 Transcript_21411/m.35027 type:complete len:202 (-) Transcript_21411:933-1538(-)
MGLQINRFHHYIMVFTTKEKANFNFHFTFHLDLFSIHYPLIFNPTNIQHKYPAPPSTRSSPHNQTILHSQNLQLIRKSNTNPIRLTTTPLQIIHLRLRIIRQYRILHTPFRHLSQIPNQRLRIIPGSTNVTRAVGGPCHGIDAIVMSPQFGYGYGWDAYIQNCGGERVHLEGGQIVVILFVPFKSQQWFQIGSFIDYCRMF